MITQADIDTIMRALVSLDERISALESIHPDIAFTHRNHRSSEEYEFYHAARQNVDAAAAQLRKLRFEAQYGKSDV